MISKFKILGCFFFFLFILFSSPLQADQILLKDGRTLEGKIIKEEDDLVWIELKWGLLKVEKSKIDKVTKALSPEEEYQGRFNKLAYNDAEGFYQLALFARKNGMKKEMEECFQKAISIDPHHKKAREELGFVFHEGRWILKSALEAQKKKAAETNSSTTEQPKVEALDNFAPPPNTSKTALEYIKKGDEMFEEAKKDMENTRQKLEKAIFYFKAASNLAYNYAVPHYKLGILYQWTREYIKAKEALTKAIYFNPKFYEALCELGDSFGWMSEYEKAIEYYNKTLVLNPKYATAYKSRALIHCYMRQFEKARDDFKAVLKITPDPYSMQMLALVEKEIKGPGWATFYTEKSEHYVVYTNTSQEYAKTISQHAELIYEVYSRVFAKKKMRKDHFPIYVFKDKKEYMAIGSPAQSAGYFHPILQKLVFYQQPDLDNTLTVLYHEGFHQYVHYYAPYIPSWFNEGNGDFFGGCRLEGKALVIKPNKWRLHMIQNAIRGNSHVKISTLMQMSKNQMYSGNKSLHYAEAWALVYFFWMFGEGKYRMLMKEYFKLIRNGYGAIEAYQKVFGKLDMEAIEKEWKAYVLGLKF